MAENLTEFRPKPPRASAAPVCGDGCRVPAATTATCAGDRFATTPVAYDAVLLLGFGGVVVLVAGPGLSALGDKLPGIGLALSLPDGTPLFRRGPVPEHS